MKTISELITRDFKATDKARRKGQIEEMLCPITPGNKTSRPATYEVEVFNFLLENKDTLGIKQVRKFTNLLVDGQIVLSDGKRLIIEVKLRMGWLKACQSEWQFKQFLNRTQEAKKNPVDGAIVIFEEFSGGGWHRKSSKAKNVWGWEAWYLYHCNSVDGKPIDLLMLRNGEIQGYPRSR